MIQKILLFSIIILSVNSTVTYSQTIKLKSLELNSINTLGISYTEYDTINHGLYNPYFTVFKNEFKNNLLNSGIKEIIFLEDTVSFESISVSEIEKICRQHDLEALLISKIYFLRKSFIYKSILDLEEIEKPSMITGKPDIYMEIKVFDRDGELIIWTDNKVQTGNSSMVSPQWTINKGLKKTLKKLTKSGFTVANSK